MGAQRSKEFEEFDLRLGLRIRAHRKLLGLTQSDLAERVGVVFQQIQKYECGLCSTHVLRLIKLARALNVSVETLIGEKSLNSVTAKSKQAA